MTNDKKIVFRVRFRHEATIEKMVVERATEKSVWVNGHRVSRETEGSRIYDDFETAKCCLALDLHTRLHDAKAKVAFLEAQFGYLDSINEDGVKTKTSRW